jgi:hypothetical protein
VVRPPPAGPPSPDRYFGARGGLNLLIA